MSNKVSLRHIEGNDMAQGHVTRQAMLFAELTRKVAKENSLTQAQVIDDASSGLNGYRRGDLVVIGKGS
jgi:hypothetical protein